MRPSSLRPSSFLPLPLHSQTLGTTFAQMPMATPISTLPSRLESLSRRNLQHSFGWVPTSPPTRLPFCLPFLCGHLPPSDLLPRSYHCHQTSSRSSPCYQSLWTSSSN